jgi:hypothetical protein
MHELSDEGPGYYQWHGHTDDREGRLHHLEDGFACDAFGQESLRVDLYRDGNIAVVAGRSRSVIEQVRCGRAGHLGEVRGAGPEQGLAAAQQPAATTASTQRDQETHAMPRRHNG